MLDALGVSALQKAVSVSGLDETGFVNRSRVTSSDPNLGLAGLISDEPLTDKHLAPIPADATVAVALRLDLQEALTKSVQLAGQLEPQAVQEFEYVLQQMGGPMNVDVRKDLLAALGDVWTLHTAPSCGGLLAGWTLAVEVKDRDKLVETDKKIVTFFNNMFGVQQLVRTKEYRGHQVHFLEAPEEQFFLAPSWCVTDTHLVITLLPQALKSHLNRLDADSSLASVPVVADRLEELKGTYFLAYQDLHNEFALFYPLLQYGAQVFAREVRRGGFDVDAALLPSVNAIATHLTPTVATAQKTEQGFESYSHSTWPTLNVGTTAPVLLAAIVPAGIQAQRAAQRARASNKLKMLALTMHNFHDVHRAMPAELQRG